MVRHGPLAFDQVGRIAYINDQMLDLSARELGLLEILLQRTGRLVSKEQLVDHLCEWGEEVSNNAIEVYVHRLRKKIEVGGVRIATVRGLGYCLEKAARHEHERTHARHRAPSRAARLDAVRRDAGSHHQMSAACPRAQTAPPRTRGPRRGARRALRQSVRPA